MATSFRPILLASALLAGMLAAAAAAAVTLLTEENPPFSYLDKGKLAGSATDVVHDMAARAAVAQRTDVLPWDTAYVRAQGERDVCLYPTARLEHRERLFQWVGPIAVNPWAVYGRGDFAPQIRSVRDLAPYRIGTVARDAKNEFLREAGVTELRPLRDDAQNPPRLLLARDDPERIDLWITGLYAGRELARAAKVQDIKVVFIANEQPLFLACNPQMDRKVVKALADALESMNADGALRRITADYEKRFAR
jgi:polar amino acid transport system substrate-binding protein